MSMENQFESITLTILTEEELKEIYIPYIKGGGLFIPLSNSEYKMGQIIRLKLKLLDEAEIYNLNCKIVLIPAKELQDCLFKGAGIAIGDEFIYQKIEFIINKNCSSLSL